ncbi:UdgX family uracil-DNA binding protein [Microbacterium sp. 4R-513]|uniref:UdgX family uracil-DNA binding protein n=1 Tax=Microbacterium sp. 4R-513 TaxID=2567934 RepID=UPI0013E1FE79|nr:UdgX family uracil-DNA binding protein [Microbacterium sp. 4R-513]QIG38069.1 UdgX family uracil-DNA binding protein [Microbacterium sp. 4R-513]
MAEPERPGADRWVPEHADVAGLRAAVQGCRGCELWANATQAVFGDGAEDARIMLVGEQPGDREDLAGEPFVGPAGRVLDEALDAAGIDRHSVYVTNAVKHFRFEQRGKRRIHAKPAVAHIDACHAWLAAELERVDPSVVVCLGATAARAVLGRTVRIGAERGRPIPHGERTVVITTHPSSVLRLRDPGERQAAQASLAADLALAAREAKSP